MLEVEMVKKKIPLKKILDNVGKIFGPRQSWT